MEKKFGSEFRIVGSAPEEEKEKVSEQLAGYFGERHLESLPAEQKKAVEEREIPKTERQRFALAFADEQSNELMRKAGVKPYNIPERNTHLVPQELYWMKVRKAVAIATTFQMDQGIAVNEDAIRGNDLLFGNLVFHELLHLKGALAVEVEEYNTAEGKSVKSTTYRGGLGVKASQKNIEREGYHEHLRGLNEAVIAAHERQSVRALMRQPAFDEEWQWMRSMEGDVKRLRVAQKAGVDSDDVFWVNPEEEKENFDMISYPQQRKMLSLLLEEIQEDIPEQYLTTEDVLHEFTKALFTGCLLPIARLVEAAFGEGSFRILGMMKDDNESPLEVFEVLRKMRAKVLSSRKKQA